MHLGCWLMGKSSSPGDDLLRLAGFYQLHKQPLENKELMAKIGDKRPLPVT